MKVLLRNCEFEIHYDVTVDLIRDGVISMMCYTANAGHYNGNIVSHESEPEPMLEFIGPGRMLSSMMSYVTGKDSRGQDLRR